MHDTRTVTKKLRTAMIARASQMTLTKVDVQATVRCDGTRGGLGTESIDYVMARKMQGNYDRAQTAALHESTKRKHQGGDDVRMKTNTACREHRRRLSTYRRTIEVEDVIANGRALMLDEDLDEFVDCHCGVKPWPQLGMRTLDEAMADEILGLSINFGITKHNPFTLEAFDFLLRGVERDCANSGGPDSQVVPPIAHPSVRCIRHGAAKDVGFFSFKFFESPCKL